MTTLHPSQTVQAPVSTHAAVSATSSANSSANTSAPTSSARDSAWRLSEAEIEVVTALRALRFGTVDVQLHEGRIVRVERRERMCFDQRRVSSGVELLP